jgi:hypothetical protein
LRPQFSKRFDPTRLAIYIGAAAVDNKSSEPRGAAPTSTRSIMLSNISFDPSTVALFGLGTLCAYWALDSLVLAIKLRKSEGVRSNVLAHNPFTGT